MRYTPSNSLLGCWSCILPLESRTGQKSRTLSRTRRGGRLWVGSMNERAFVPEGTLFRIDADLSVHSMLDHIVVPNSIAFSPDDRTLYFADIRTYRIWRFDFDLSEGRISNRRVFAETRPPARPAAHVSMPTVFFGTPISPEPAWFATHRMVGLIESSPCLSAIRQAAVSAARNSTSCLSPQRVIRC